MLVIAHRGSNRKFLENSMPAFLSSIEDGATRIELDLQLSIDFGIFINHDDSLKKTAGKDILISKTDSVKLKSLKLISGDPIPTLDDVLELLPKIELNLEVKGRDLRLIEKLVEQLNVFFTTKCSDQNQKKKIIISSFEEDMLVHLKKVAPEYTRAFLWEQTTPFRLPMAAIKKSMDKIGTKIFHPDCTKINQEMMQTAKAEGWTVYTWAPLKADIEKENWPKLKEFKVDGHCTNFPFEFNNWLAKNN